MKKLLFISLFMITALVCNAQSPGSSKTLYLIPPSMYVITSFDLPTKHQETVNMAVVAQNLKDGEEIVVDYSFSSGNASGNNGTFTLTSKKPTFYPPTHYTGEIYCYIQYQVKKNTSNASFYVTVSRSYR